MCFSCLISLFSEMCSYHFSPVNSAGIDDVCSFGYCVCETSIVILYDRTSRTCFERCNAGSGVLTGVAYCFYMQALALNKLGMKSDAQEMLNDGASLEAKKQNSWRI